MKRQRKDGYTKEHIDYLRKIGDMTGRTNEEITEMFNTKFKQSRTVTAIVGTKNRNNIKSYTRAYTEKQLDYLKEISPGRTSKQITSMFNKAFNENRTESSVKTIRNDNQIKTGNTGKFQKGKTPLNHRPVGSERICSKNGYVIIKTAEPSHWEHKHRVLWEKENGPVPEGHVILFGDGNKQNLSLDNLILISKNQLARLNQYDLIQNHADLTKTALNIIDVKLKISEKKARKTNGN